MSKAETDILQIRKYLNGELDAKAMHRLERRAQADPFLMDALEGYQSAKNDQQANLDELAGRLKQRIEPKRARIIPFRLIGIAASILVLCAVGVWWLQGPGAKITPPVKDRTVAATKEAIATDTAIAAVPPPSAPAPSKHEIKSRIVKHVAPVTESDAMVKAPPVEDIKGAGVANESRSTLNQPVANPSVDTSLFVRKSSFKSNTGDILKSAPHVDSTALNEMIVMEYKGQKKKDTLGSKLLHADKNLSAANYKSPTQQLVGQAPGVTVNRNPNYNTPASVNGVPLPQSVRDAANDLMAKQMIKGEVISREGQPLVDVKVKVAGTNTSTYTDKKGQFTLTDSSKSDLVIEGKGYQTRKVSANNRDSVKKISLEPGSDSDLAEVVVTGYTSQAKDGEQTVVFSHPQDGWGSYRKYLKRNAISADGNVGVVKVAFMVDKFGSISDIKVLKGLSEATNKKAVSLIKDGPGWIGNSNKKPERVTLRIRFSK